MDYLPHGINIVYQQQRYQIHHANYKRRHNVPVVANRFSFPRAATGMSDLTWVKTTDIPIWRARKIHVVHGLCSFASVLCYRAAKAHACLRR